MTPQTLHQPAAGRAASAGHHLLTISCMGLGFLIAAIAIPAHAAEPADRFVQHLAAMDGIPVAARDMIQRSWAECDDCDGEEFLTQGLTVIFAPFREALDAYDLDQYDACSAKMAGLASHEDPFVSVNAAAYEIKSLIALDRLIEAGGRLDTLVAKGGALTEYSYFAPEMTFLQGYCLLADMQYDGARAALEAFLTQYPDAPERLTLAARQMLAELSTRQPGRISDVVDLMTFSQRRLKNLDSSELVRTRQQRIIDILDRMIEEAENKEKSDSGGGGGGSGSGKTPSSPMQDSQLPGGGASGGGALGQAPKASPGEMWGAMPAANREAILQALRESFPGRYRHLVEQYFEQLAKKK